MMSMRTTYRPRRRDGLYHAALHQTARVLVADDDDEVRDLVSETLRDDGYEVHEATDGLALLELIGSMLLGEPTAQPFELIISDVRLPGGVSGLDMLAGIRRADWSLPVLLVTGYGDAAVYEEAARLGAWVLDKPLDLDDLRTAAFNLAPPQV